VAPLFITFEGIDGAGKTTQLHAVAWFLRKQKRKVRLFREPGGTLLGDHLRSVLLDGEAITARAEASLFAAARAELVERSIRPSLDAGWDVICDRYVDSSLAYQAYGRGLDFDQVAAWNAYIVDGVTPTRTYFLSLAAEDASYRLARQLQLFGEDKDVRGPPDRLERESIAFRRRVQDGYEQLAARFSERIVILDALQRPNVIKESIREDLRELLVRDLQPELTSV
jgi:dTMP kinase